LELVRTDGRNQKPFYLLSFGPLIEEWRQQLWPFPSLPAQAPQGMHKQNALLCSHTQARFCPPHLATACSKKVAGRHRGLIDTSNRVLIHLGVICWRYIHTCSADPTWQLPAAKKWPAGRGLIDTSNCVLIHLGVTCWRYIHTCSAWWVLVNLDLVPS
jgi:hypothetical protein